MATDNNNNRLTENKRRNKLNRDNVTKLLVVLVDILLINASYVAAFYIRFAQEVRLTGRLPMFNYEPFLVAIPFITLSSLVYIDVFGLLKFYRKSRRAIMSSIMKLVMMQALTTTAITYFMYYSSFPRSVLITTPIIQAVALVVWNWVMLVMQEKSTVTSSVMIIGKEAQEKELSDKLGQGPLAGGMEVKYRFHPQDRDTCLKCIKKVDEVLICSDLSEDFKMEIILICMDRRKVAWLVPEVFEIALLSTRIVHFGDMPLLMADSFSLTVEQRFFKRAFDLIASLLSMPLMLPLFGVIALVIKLGSPGAVFYRQDRVTAGGRIFRIFKFRTMYDDAESETGPVLSHKGDERVTPAGRFLRRYRLDEFPQLFNVIKGDMSLVGPRSERPYFVEQYVKSIDGYSIRNTVRAGITGYAQIFGNYDTSAEHKLKYDLIYIKNYSLLLDIKLILQTVNVILMGQGDGSPPTR